MGGCSVSGCKNDMRKKITPDTSFHKFPKGNLNLSRQWTAFCKRSKEINIQTARICSLHFVEEDFVNTMKFKMGFTAFHLLKPDAVPTVYLNLKEPSIAYKQKVKPSTSERPKRINLKSKKDIVNDFLEVELVEVDEETTDCFNEAHIDELNDQVKTLREENDDLKKQLVIRDKTIKTLEDKMIKAELDQSRLRKQLLKLLKDEDTKSGKVDNKLPRKRIK